MLRVVITRVQMTIRTPDNQWRQKARRWRHFGVFFYYCPEDEGSRRHRLRSLCVTSVHWQARSIAPSVSIRLLAFPQATLGWKIEVGCHCSERARVSLWLFVRPLGRERATNVQRGSLRPSQTDAENPQKTRRTLVENRERVIVPAGRLLTLLNIYWHCCHQVSNTLNCGFRHHTVAQSSTVPHGDPETRH